MRIFFLQFDVLHHLTHMLTSCG